MKLRTTKANNITIIVGGINISGAPLQASELSALRRKHTRIIQGVEVVDGAELTIELFDREVTGWDAKSLETGEDIPCTAGQKRIVYENNPDFVAEVMAKLSAAAAAERSEEQGNSQPGPSTTSAQAK